MILRIAIASSGLGHVARGIEAWAEDTAAAVAQTGDQRPETKDQGQRIKVTLFAAGEVDGKEERARSTFKEDGSQRARNGGRWAEHRTPNAIPAVIVLPCWRRSGRIARVLARLSPGFTWRWGFKSPYGWEQFSFWRKLEPELRRGDFDILHVQDPMLAYWCRRARLKGRVRTQEILAHGTEESVEFLSQFEFVQHLAPWHLEQAKRGWTVDG